MSDVKTTKVADSSELPTDVEVGTLVEVESYNSMLGYVCHVYRPDAGGWWISMSYVGVKHDCPDCNYFTAYDECP